MIIMNIDFCLLNIHNNVHVLALSSSPAANARNIVHIVIILEKHFSSYLRG